jgi:hypothetical protein
LEILRPKTLFWKSNKGIKNAAYNAGIENDTSSPSRGSPQVILAPQNSVLKKQQRHKKCRMQCVHWKRYQFSLLGITAGNPCAPKLRFGKATKA